MSGSTVARNTLWNLIGQGAPLALALLAIPYLLDGLGADAFGVLSLGWIVVGYFMVVGFGRAATRHIAAVIDHDPARVASITWTAVALQAAIGVAGGLLLALSARLLVTRVFEVPEALHAEAIAALRLLGLGVPVVMVTGVFQGVLEAVQRFDLVNLVRIPSVLATFGLPVVGLWLGLGLPGIMLLLVGGKAAVLIAYLLLALRVVAPARQPARPTRDSLIEIVRFGAWATLGSGIAVAIHYMELIGIGMIAGVAAAGYYNAPFEVVTRLRILPAALVMTLFPAISSLHGLGETERSVRLSRISMHFVLMTMGLIGVAVIAAAPDLLRLWLGEEAQQVATLATQILAVGIVVNSIAYVPFTLVQGLDRPDVPAKLYLVELPLQIAVVWFFVRWWGLTGAALAWTLRATADGVLLIWLAGRLTNRSAGVLVDAGFVRSSLVLMAAGASCILATTTLDALAVRAGVVIAILILAGAALWQWSMTAMERAHVRGALVTLWPTRAELPGES